MGRVPSGIQQEEGISLKKQLIVSALVLLAASCIGWNNEQREVVDSYRTLVKDTDEENWHSLAGGFTNETVQLLDNIAMVYTQAGVPFDNQGEELLAALVSETDFLLFPETVISVDFRNEKAYLVSGRGSDARSFEFAREDRLWKLNLVSDLNEYIALTMEGTPLPSQSSSQTNSPTYISKGTGDCKFALRNDLDHISLWNVYCSPSNSDSWGEDWLESSILGPEAEMGIWLESGTYDIRLVDSSDNTYTLREVELDEQGVFWSVTSLDKDETF
jgi:hypothetical protein